MMIAKQKNYDVVIIGGGMIGASVAWFLKKHFAFAGSVLVVERDLTYEFASTSHTNSCIRQQFSSALNIRLSQYTVEFIGDFAKLMGADAPSLKIQNFGYLYLAADAAQAEALHQAQALQAKLGVGAAILTPDDIAARYPFYHLDDIVLGALNTKDEGYFEGSTIFEWFRHSGRDAGVEAVENEVVAIGRDGRNIHSITLKSGEEIGAGVIVNASGTRASATAEMAGFAPLPIEPRCRLTYIIAAANPPQQAMPLTVDPAGFHFRTYGTDGRHFMVGIPPADDVARRADDFSMDYDYWQDYVWPLLASRVPCFETVKLKDSWAGHYAFNTLDQNAVVGLHPDCDNFIFVNGFSGHGLQQAPGMGRGVAELIVHGGYQSLDLSPLGVERILENRPYVETAVI